MNVHRIIGIRVILSTKWMLRDMLAPQVMEGPKITIVTYHRASDPHRRCTSNDERICSAKEISLTPAGVAKDFEGQW